MTQKITINGVTINLPAGISIVSTATRGVVELHVSKGKNMGRLTVSLKGLSPTNFLALFQAQNGDGAGAALVEAIRGHIEKRADYRDAWIALLAVHPKPLSPLEEVMGADQRVKGLSLVMSSTEGKAKLQYRRQKEDQRWTVSSQELDLARLVLVKNTPIWPTFLKLLKQAKSKPAVQVIFKVLMIDLQIAESLQGNNVYELSTVLAQGVLADIDGKRAAAFARLSGAVGYTGAQAKDSPPAAKRQRKGPSPEEDKSSEDKSNFHAVPGGAGPGAAPAPAPAVPQAVVSPVGDVMAMAAAHPVAPDSDSESSGVFF